MVTAGVAIGLLIPGLFNPLTGSQLYITAPVAVRSTALPLQIRVSLLTVTTGNGSTVTITVSVDAHGGLLTVTMYVVVTVGEANGLAINGLLMPLKGDQL